MKKDLLIAIPLVALSVTQVIAQTREVSGRITDRATGQGLPGVTVLVKGTTTGVSTNSDGSYTIAVPASATTLAFSSIGFVNVERAIGTDNVINIGLASDSKQLGEVVVSALGVRQARDEQGVAVSQVQGSAVARSGETSAITGLSGKSSGLQVTRTGGDPGAGAYIQIRGQNSVTGSNQPLIIVDGVPISNSTLGSDIGGVVQQSRLNDINPNDIESIQILKGAAASAQWGSRAANGVIYITTKRGGSDSGKLSITYGTTYSADRVSYKHDLQDTYGRGSQGVAALTSNTTGNSWGDKISTRSGAPDVVNSTGSGGFYTAQNGQVYYPITKKNSQETFLDKNFDGVFQTGHFLENNLSLSAGNKDGNIFLSVSDLNQKGIVRNNSDYRRTTGRVNAFRNFNDIVKIAGNMTYSRVESNRIQQGSNTSGLYLGLLRQSPDFDQGGYIGSYTAPNGDVFLNRQRSYRRQIGNSPSPAYNNPLWTINEQSNPNEVDRFLGNVELNVTPRPWLTFTVRPGVDTYTDSRRTIFPINSAENGGGGSATEEIITETQFNADAFVRATHTFNNFLSGNLLVGTNFNQRQARNIGASYLNFILDVRDQSFFANATKANVTAFDLESKQRTSAGYATAGLVIGEQVFLNATGRLENASTFGPQTKSRFFYPSVDVAWQFSKLGALADNKILSFGKLRAAYGQVGLQPGSASSFAIYLTRDVYRNADNTESYGPFLDPAAYSGSFARNFLRGNPLLKPERKSEIEVGTDLRFLQDRISLSATYYQNEITDAILPVPVAASSGYTSEYANAAKLENKGIELDLNAMILKKEDFTWSVGGNWTRNRNKVTDLAGAESVFLNGFTGVSSRAVKGEPLGTLWGGRWDRDDAGKFVLDADGFPQQAATEGVIGNPNPKWRSGINTNLTYKGVRLFALWETSFGGDIWAGTEGVLRNFGTSTYTDVETTLSAADAQRVKTYDGITVAQKYSANADGSYTFRGRLQDFGAGNVALDQTWFTTQGGGFGAVGEQFIQDASWTRLRELTMGYTLQSEAFRNLTRLQNVELTLTGRNLLLFTKEFKGVDPETNLTGASNGRGLEYFNNPGTRSFLVGLRITY
ncbi:SusC/RagA family TonB-linked outer membrane protein [Hymenobacter rubripertinctus]|uniref:SusC/RagA family TonB-linked outer membrane protein n=1 Tax=Hymenobacter rubripertinctus TaxID=2029981 RepID=A0A418QVE8_9BACT|nr:SusC/RagA family TonB-linked outer membrane protein [Hymenobacter rubripertinctus]RIY09114.1 SusC/RagA family TonB-linked outer membrane protein [Hymenobacter rubripertinctus]